MEKLFYIEQHKLKNDFSIMKNDKLFCHVHEILIRTSLGSNKLWYSLNHDLILINLNGGYLGLITSRDRSQNVFDITLCSDLN